MDMNHRNRVAQWAFDTRSVLARFHLWLEDIEDDWNPTRHSDDAFSFVGSSLEKAFIMTAAVTALGTRLFGRYGEADGLDKTGINRVKKDADAMSAYAMSEGLWHLARTLPENHAVMVSLGEGLMPKAGETPEMGSNPNLGFGRVYARPQVARSIDRRVHRLINDSAYGWGEFWEEVTDAGLTIWGAAIDTLENTSRFAKGSETGPLAVLHLFDQPLNVALPYEGYMGSLVLPDAVVEAAEERSLLASYLTPRAEILKAIQLAYPDIEPENVHVWTLGGASREERIGSLWRAWQALGVHVVEDGWALPDGGRTFNESGTYAPTFRVGSFVDGKTRHVFICDGYAASAEAMQAASLDPMLGIRSSMCVFSSMFDASWERESGVMRLDPTSDRFPDDLSAILDRPLAKGEAGAYREVIEHARAANMPLGSRTITVDDFFPNKTWRALALSSAMLDDPYTGMSGVEMVGDQTYAVSTRAVTRAGVRTVRATLRLMESHDESRRVFSPLLDRFFAGEPYRDRPVKISDSGRIRNELQTWCSEALEHTGQSGIRVCFDRIDESVLTAEKRAFIREVLEWYKAHHPYWFRWLELA